MYRFVISIINYKTPVETMRCVKSVLAVIDKTSDIIVVVDNYSNDGSVDALRNAICAEGLEDNVALLTNAVNGGFSYGHNTVIQHYQAQYYYLLNSDAIIENLDFDYVIQVFNDNPSLGVLSTKVHNFDDSWDPEGFNNATIGTELLTASQDALIKYILLKVFGVKPVVVQRGGTDYLLQVEWASFCSVFLSHETVTKVGLLDSGYFMYLEDNDYCRRAYQQGMWVGVARSQSVMHESLGLSGQSLKRKPKFFYESRRRYYIKFYGVTGYYLANIMYCLGFFVDSLKSVLLRRSKRSPKKAWLDVWVRVNE